MRKRTIVALIVVLAVPVIVYAAGEWGKPDASVTSTTITKPAFGGYTSRTNAALKGPAVFARMTSSLRAWGVHP